MSATPRGVSGHFFFCIRFERHTVRRETVGKHASQSFPTQKMKKKKKLLDTQHLEYILQAPG